MTTVASRPQDGAVPRARARAIGLSGRLILMTMSFVALVQVLIYVPSAVTFVRGYVSHRVMGAQMIALSISAAPQDVRSPELDAKLLAGLRGAKAIGVRGAHTRWLLASPGTEPPEVHRTVDLREASWWRAAGGVVRVLTGRPSRPIHFIGPGVPGIPEVEWVEFVADVAPLRHELVEFTRNFLLSTLLVSAGTGALLYWALHVLVVRPVRRLSTNIAEFATNPEDVGRVIRPSGRRDEIGRAEEALAVMEATLAAELRRKRHLADLGLAVSKINHELRNMLTTAQLLGDRLGEVEDPTVRGIAPRLVRTLDRAIAFCGATLAYGRASEPAPQRRMVALKPLVEEQLDFVALPDGRPISVALSIPDGLMVDADPDQLARVLLNLLRNAAEALARTEAGNTAIEVSGERRGGTVMIRVADDGPGIPERNRTRLFSAFQASERAGGTGLGLPVAEELVRLHGGTIVLERQAVGASFLITLPDRQTGT
ncbi:MAG: histidine kinase [Enterovirga sp.]|nr:histidine kinase [Enterovirga sp.]